MINKELNGYSFEDEKDQNGDYVFIAPFKYDDLFRLIVQPTPHFKKKINKYKERVATKQWEKKWEILKILHLE